VSLARRPFALYWLVGVCAFVAVCAVPHSPLFGDPFDSPALSRSGEAIAAGAWPYRDVFLEYQPGAIPALVLPALLPHIGYGTGFKLLECLFMVALLAGAAAILASSHRRVRDSCAIAAITGASPLLLGALALDRFDLLPAALTCGAVALLIRGRPTGAFTMLALGSATKVYPLALGPIFVITTARTSGWQAVRRPLAVFAGIGAIIALPLFLFAQDGFTNSVLYHRNRPLQIESLGASALIGLHLLGHGDPTIVFTYGSVNLAGSIADGLALVSSAAALAAVAVVTWLFARGEATHARVLVGVTTAIAAVVLMAKVFSSQFVLWLLPFALLLRGKAGAACGALYVTCLVLTRLVYEDHGLWELERQPAVLLVVRNAVMLALFGLLTWMLGSGTGRLKPPRRGFSPDAT
jgi:uncharacterized membrane protein